MSHHTNAPHQRDDGPAPLMQRLYDNIWLLFVASLIVILGFYLVWGMIDLILVPTLP